MAKSEKASKPLSKPPRKSDGSAYTFEEKLRVIAQASCYRHFTPFESQRELYSAIFEKGCRIVFLQCGRGWSKTFSAAWVCSVAAMFFPGWYVLYLAPQLKQAKKIVWYPKLFENFIDEALIVRKDNQEYFYELANGSRIEVDGSENYDSQRGLRPNLVVADEYREFSPEWIDVMFPNVGKSGGKIIFMGTPPEFPVLASGEPHHYVQWADLCKKWMKEDPRKVYYIHAPTGANPFYPRDFLADEQKRLHDLDMDHVWAREYEARIVLGSSRQVFRMFSQDKHVVSHDVLREMLEHEPGRFELYCSADPGTRTTFAVLMMAIDVETGTPYWLDEIYESDTSFTTTRNIVPSLIAKCWELYPDLSAWDFVADSAAAWFMEEASDWIMSEEAREWFESSGIPYFQVVFAGTQKRMGDKEEGIALLKEIFNERADVMSDRCEHTALEFINCQTNKQGRIIKSNDHQIDNTRYVLKASQFSIVKEHKPKRVKREDEFGWTSVSANYAEWKKQRDWTYGVF